MGKISNRNDDNERQLHLMHFASRLGSMRWHTFATDDEFQTTLAVPPDLATVWETLKRLKATTRLKWICGSGNTSSVWGLLFLSLRSVSLSISSIHQQKFTKCLFKAGENVWKVGCMRFSISKYVWFSMQWCLTQSVIASSTTTGKST